MLPKHTTFRMNSITNGKRNVEFYAKPTLHSASTSTMICGHPWYQLRLPYAWQAPRQWQYRHASHDRSFLPSLPYAWLCKDTIDRFCFAKPTLRLVTHVDSGHCLSVQDTIDRLFLQSLPYAWLLGTSTVVTERARHDRSIDLLFLQSLPYARQAPRQWSLRVQRHDGSIDSFAQPTLCSAGTSTVAQIIIIQDTIDRFLFCTAYPKLGRHLDSGHEYRTRSIDRFAQPTLCLAGTSTVVTNDRSAKWADLSLLAETRVCVGA
jgi:hypothetical protein